MADVEMALLVVLRQEDAELSGAISDTHGDLGGKTRFGIASKFHPELLAGTFYTTMSAIAALQEAKGILAEQYAAPLALGDIKSQQIADGLLSFAVVAGPVTAVSALQQAVNMVFASGHGPLEQDGVMGVRTLDAVNGSQEVSLLDNFRLQMIEHYKDICQRDPSQLKFLCGWINRALA